MRCVVGRRDRRLDGRCGAVRSSVGGGRRTLGVFERRQGLGFEECRRGFAGGFGVIVAVEHLLL